MVLVHQLEQTLQIHDAIDEHNAAAVAQIGVGPAEAM